MQSRFYRVLRLVKRGSPDKPLIARNSRNIFHDQALIQLASVYESLEYGDSTDAREQVYELGERLFGRERFDRAIRHGSAGP